MSDSSVNFPASDFIIRVGAEEDRSKIEDFALRLAEDPISSADKWIKIINQNNVHPLIAELDGKVVGKVQVRIIDTVGWLESARVSPGYRKKGIAVSLLNTALDWIKDRGVTHIRAAVDSDNLKIRQLLEKHYFTSHVLLINPTAYIDEKDTSPQYIAKFSSLLDNTVFSKFNDTIEKYFSGSIMVDGQYIPFTHELFDKLIKERRILTNGNGSFVIISKHKMDEQLNTFVFAESQEQYRELGMVSKALAAQELASLLECHAPAKRMAVQGLIEAGLGWDHPHTLIIYQRNNIH
ncbi:MAG: GNAT family N-acetyltransferase [Candidatus Kariarchaeaceae archaeon]|jgi:GNAT superfamily N-acetyltransferase